MGLENERYRRAIRLTRQVDSTKQTLLRQSRQLESTIESLTKSERTEFDYWRGAKLRPVRGNTVPRGKVNGTV